MKYSFLIWVFLFWSCAPVPPNSPVCYTDSLNHANCAFMIEGNDFPVDNSGSHQFTQSGRNWNYTQLTQNSLIMPPDSYGAIKVFILNYCKQNSSACTYSDMATKFNEFEMKSNILGH